MRIADRWFERKSVDDDITLLWEPHAAPLIRCNIWHVRGRERDLLVDTGLGIASLREAARDLLERRVTAVATHFHYDHTGGLHEFQERIAHPSEASLLESPPSGMASLRADFLGEAFAAQLVEAGEISGEELVTAYPHEGFDADAYRVRPAAPTHLVEEGDVVDLGDRAFRVLHLPGHSPGSIGLFEERSGTLFSGDAIYDGLLLDELPYSNIADYVATMRRLRELPVSVVHAGHQPSFGRERLVALVDDYLELREARSQRGPG